MERVLAFIVCRTQFCRETNTNFYNNARFLNVILIPLIVSLRNPCSHTVTCPLYIEGTTDDKMIMLMCAGRQNRCSPTLRSAISTG